MVLIAVTLLVCHVHMNIILSAWCLSEHAFLLRQAQILVEVEEKGAKTMTRHLIKVKVG